LVNRSTGMRKCLPILLIFVLLPTTVALAIDQQKARPFVGQDLHLQGPKLISYQLSTNQYALVFPQGFSVSIGANQFSSNQAVVWLQSTTSEFQGRVRIDYHATIYLYQDISVKKGLSAKTTPINEMIIEPGQTAVLRFNVTGEIFVTADKRELSDPRSSKLYKHALTAVTAARTESVRPKPPAPRISSKLIKPNQPGFIETLIAREEESAKLTSKPTVPEAKKPIFLYPVNIAPAGERAPQIQSTREPDGTIIETVIGRLYVWQKQDEKGRLLELQADNAVVFRLPQQPLLEKEQTTAENILAKGSVKTIYMSGDVVMTDGLRTIRADEIIYDFQKKKALVVNATMRNFDVDRGIPIYVRAKKLYQIAENKFAAENITLTSSEFHEPQLSLSASSVIITDTTTLDQQAGSISKSSYDARMRDVRMKLGGRTIFYWPVMHSNLERPDVPIKSAHLGSDNTWGTSLETRWYLSRLLGLVEPEGVDSTFDVDFYSKRGLGSGAEIEYQKEKYFGKLLGYLVSDTGQDRLGRYSTRKDLDPPRKLRGRFYWLHRQFLPHNWQLTTGIGYLSDENFLESFYRSDFNIGLDQETYLYLKRLQDNWAIDILTKGRINNFADELEELPSFGFHLIGQSLFEDKLTLYSDTQASRLRQKIGNDHTVAIDKDFFSFLSHRTELDMPFSAGTSKIVPYLAGTFAYDDRSGFTRTLVDGTNAGSFGDDAIWVGEAGLRASTQYWKVYPNVKSRLWDLNQLRHIIRPHLTTVLYDQSDPVVKQRDTVNLGISQRLQTKRAGTDPHSSFKTIDWMRLDTDFTWVKDSDTADAGPDRFIWNKPFVPMRVFAAPAIFNSDLQNSLGLRKFELFGPRRNSFTADYLWRASDTTAVLADMNYDMQSGGVQQFNIGLARLCWPDLSYYIGSRYLKRINVLDENGSNAFTFAATYILNPRYTLVFSQQFDFDYGANIRSDITLIRRYHRIYCGFTFSADASLDRQSVVFSIWPQGVAELAIGPRRYMGLGGSVGY